jgi:MFS family permease
MCASYLVFVSDFEIRISPRPSPMSRLAQRVPEPQRPTRVRYNVLVFACTAAMLTYLDRACIGSAKGHIQEALGLSEGDLKWAFSAFPLAYALFEVPNGWLADVFGPRRVLLRIVLWWSAFTAVLGLVGLRVAGFVLGGVGLLAVVQFLCGMGEAGAFPNITRALHNWFPYQERGLTQGAVWTCGRLMGGLTPLVWMVLVEGVARPGAEPGEALLLAPLVHWRAVFLIFGLVGVAWCAWFVLGFRNRPEENPRVNAAELVWIRSGAAVAAPGHAAAPWGRILRSSNLWLLGLMYACQSYGWWFYLTYLPTYFKDHYQVPAASPLGAIYAGGPLWMGAVGCLVGGFLTDAFIRRTGNRRWGRRLFGVLGHASTAVCFALLPLAPSAFGFFIIVSLGGFATDLTMAAAWATCQDIGRRWAAIVAGFMNMLGAFGGALGSWMFGHIPQSVGPEHGGTVSFLVAAGLYVVGVLCWLRIDASRPLVPDDAGGALASPAAGT